MFLQVRELKSEIKKLKKDLAVDKPMPFAEFKKCALAPSLCVSFLATVACRWLPQRAIASESK